MNPEDAYYPWRGNEQSPDTQAYLAYNGDGTIVRKYKRNESKNEEFARKLKELEELQKMASAGFTLTEEMKKDKRLYNHEGIVYRDDRPCGEIHSKQKGEECILNYHDETSTYEVEKFRDTFKEDFFKTKDDVTPVLMQYINGYFNGSGKMLLDGKMFAKKVKERFEGRDLMFFFDAPKMKRASTFCEEYEYFTIWDTDFDKNAFYPYFEEGVSLDDLMEDWNKITKKAADRFYLEGSNGKINMYYFRVFASKENVDKNKNSGYNKVSKVSKVSKETKGENMNNRNFGDKAVQNGKEVLDMNKNAVKLAAKLKVGSTANKVGLDMVRKALPKRFHKATKHPVAEVLLANVVAMAMKQASVGNQKAEVVSDAMVTAGMVDLVNTIDLKDMLDKIIESVDVSAFTDVLKSEDK